MALKPVITAILPVKVRTEYRHWTNFRKNIDFLCHAAENAKLAPFLMKVTIEVWISLVLAVSAFFAFRPGALPLQGDTVNGNGNWYANYMFLSKWKDVPIDSLPKQWRSRQAACYLSAWYLDLTQPKTQAQEINSFASYNAIWFAATLGVLLWMRAGIIPIFGTFAAVICNAMPNYAQYILPWDMPEMFLFTLAFALYRRKNWIWLGIVIFIGAFVKETVLVCGFFFFAAPWPRIAKFSVLGGLILSTQIINSLALPSGHLSWLTYLNAFSFLRVFDLWPIIFADAGGLILLIYCLVKKREWPVIYACGAFILGQCANNMEHGVYDEFREWSALAPMIFVLLEELLRTEPAANKSLAPMAEKNRPAAKSTRSGGRGSSAKIQGVA